MILCASLGQALLQFAGARIRDRITWQPVRAVDAVGGAVLSAVAVLLVAWALGVAVSGSGIAGITGQVRNSAVLAEVDEVLPAAADTALGAFNDVVGSGFFPRYLEPVRPGADRRGRARARSGCSPTPTSRRAEASVLKIRGTNDCGRGVEGTGFVYADGRVMTNAHVVAGVDDPEVEIGGDTGRRRGRLYDPDLDVAVLAVDTAACPALPFDDRRREAASDGRRDPRLPPGRPVRRPGRPDPRRAAAPLARHLRRRHRHPRGVLAARPGPAGQLRRPDRHRPATSRAWSSRRRSPTTTPATR